jgi:hypothetical protein
MVELNSKNLQIMEMRVFFFFFCPYYSMRKQPKERPAPEELMVSKIFLVIILQL